ncbi:MAG: CPBP family intramembrane metalloprotease [Phycisphaerae bacterium]|nr:CPBP family intramembrane metalloprotease [Phycisphaerae bacterium]
MSVARTIPHPDPHLRDTPPADDGGAPVAAAGMFDLTRLEQPPPGWTFAVLPAAIAWLGGVAFLGQFRSNQIAEAIGAIVPLGPLFWVCIGLAAAGTGGAVFWGRRKHAALWAGVLGYLAGHALFASLPVHHVIDFTIPFRSTADGMAFAAHRLVYGMCVAISAGSAVALAAAAVGSWPRFHLGIGAWGAIGRDFTHTSKPETYRKAMLGFAVFAAILWVVGQMSVELRPLRSGQLWGLIPAILLAALANALIEEIIYRGVLQPAFVHAAGIARGLWIQGLMFGLLHWGVSVGVVAALPTSLLIGVGSVFWGKAALETRGLSWVIVAHALIDVAIMCAYFTPRL